MGLASLPGVHPSHYPFVRNGPPCSCTHSRLAHVGKNKYDLPAADVGCSECGLCERYTPLEAIDHAAEELQRDEILAEQARRTVIHRRITLLLLIPLGLMIPVAVWAPSKTSWVIGFTVIAGLVNMGVSAHASWRVGDLDRSELVMQLGMGWGIIAFFLTLFAGMTVLAYCVLGIVLAFTFGFGFITQRWLKRSMRSMNLLMADLKKERDE
jgi:ferredoxin